MLIIKPAQKHEYNIKTGQIHKNKTLNRQKNMTGWDEDDDDGAVAADDNAAADDNNNNNK